MSKSKDKSVKTKFENNWLSKTLENLEKDYWSEPEEKSYLVMTCHKLRKKQLKDFETEDLRIMIGQDIGLKYLIPLALETLTTNILAEGDFYEGDLLTSVLTSQKKYWQAEVENWKMMCDLFNRNKQLLTDYETTKEIKNGWFTSFAKFEKIN